MSTDGPSMFTGLGGSRAASTAAAGTEAGRLRQMRELAHEMEAVFLSLMMKTMRESVPENAFVGGGFAQQTFQAMGDDETARAMARQGGLGIGWAVFRQLAERVTGRAFTELAARKAYEQAGRELPHE